MYRIRMAALGAAVALGFSAQAQAQQGQPQAGQQGGRGERAERAQHGRAGGPLLRGIDLTDAQRSQVQAIGEKYRAERRLLRPQESARPDSAQRARISAQVRQLNQRQQAELRAVLTPAQQAQFDRNVAEVRERMERRGERGARGQRGRHGARAQAGVRGAALHDGRHGALRGIDLTASQRTQLRTLHERQRAEREALVKQIRADGQKPDSAERTRLRDLAQRQRGEVRALLTPAQQTRFDANVADRQKRAGDRARKGGARRGA